MKAARSNGRPRDLKQGSAAGRRWVRPVAGPPLAPMPMPLPTSQQLHAALAEHFGYDRFRPGQERIIRCLLQGRDVVALMPTGAGKSLPFQLAAQFLPGPTLVVSPLIAL